MKNIIKTLKNSILVVTIFASMLSTANEITNDKIISTAITLNNVKVGNLLSIRDYNGAILYKETLTISGTYRKGFDLSALPDGDYFFEIDKDLEVTNIPFTVASKKVTYKRAEQTTIFKPYVNQVNDMLFVSKLAPNLEALTISIYSDYNSEYELIHTEKVEGVQAIEKVYKLQKGNYKIVFNSNNKEFTKFINN
jgi:hypothetical protein